jgi:hypothetical protein
VFDRLPASPHAQIFNDGIIVHYNPRAGVGSGSLDGNLTRVPFGRSAIDDAERDRVSVGRRCRFALDEARSSGGSVRVATLIAM